MNEWQAGLTIGQIAGTLAAMWLFVRSFKAEFERFRQEHYNKLEILQKEHYRLREEIAEKYLKRDEWLSHHNKLEAQTIRKLERIEELLRGSK